MLGYCNVSPGATAPTGVIDSATAMVNPLVEPSALAANVASTVTFGELAERVALLLLPSALPPLGTMFTGAALLSLRSILAFLKTVVAP